MVEWAVDEYKKWINEKGAVIVVPYYLNVMLIYQVKQIELLFIDALWLPLTLTISLAHES